MNKERRIKLYVVGILIMTGIIIYQELDERCSRSAVEQVRQLVQEREEFKHRWFGVGVIQYPTDLISYAELVWEVRPEVIIETGTNYGGLSVFLASVLEKLDGNAKVITIDIDRKKWEETLDSIGLPPGYDKKIVFIQGDSVSSMTIEAVRHHAAGKRGLVILDSLHTTEHVLKELTLYSEFVGLNSYMIVNDTHLDEIGLVEGNGPKHAVKRFIQTSKNFEVDTRWPGSQFPVCPWRVSEKGQTLTVFSDDVAQNPSTKFNALLSSY